MDDLHPPRILHISQALGCGWGPNAEIFINKIEGEFWPAMRQPWCNEMQLHLFAAFQSQRSSTLVVVVVVAIFFFFFSF